MSSETHLLSVRGLKKHFPIVHKGFLRRVTGYVKAVDDVSFDILPGETLGLVGESGSGKTTTARAILRAVRPTAGSVLFHANGRTVDLSCLHERDLKPLRRSMQMIFQDPFSSLNPRMTVGDLVGEPLVIHSLAKGRDLRARVADMLERVGLDPAHTNRYPHAFSGGQRQRIAIARALIMRPAFIVADEPVSALDVSVQAQVINLLKDLQGQFGFTYLFVAHDLSVVKHLCDRVAVMYAGRIVELAPTEAVFGAPQHPYTQALISAVPNPDPDIPMKFDLVGEVADPANLPPGCSFQRRCSMCFERCMRDVPPLVELGAGHLAACHIHAQRPSF